MLRLCGRSTRNVATRHAIKDSYCEWGIAMTAYSEDFTEIAHCGGQATFAVRCDENGALSIAARFRGSSPGPMVMIAIYAAVPQGFPVSDVRMGGIGQAFEPACPAGCMAVFLGSDSHGKWGHRCPRCSGYYRNGTHPAIYPLTCPYCGLRTQAFHFLTEAHVRYIKHYIATYYEAIEADLEPGTETEFVIDMDAIARSEDTGNRPDFYYVSETQQTRFECVKCGEFNDIRGLYGYCASCGNRNNMASLNDIFQKLRSGLKDKSISPDVVVSRAVSAFDASCRDMISQLKKRIPMKPARMRRLERLVFHDIESPTFNEVKSAFEIDLLKGIDEPTTGFLKMMLERRHIYEHNGGVADERYVERSGDETWRAGDLIRETDANAHQLLNTLPILAQNLQDDFHEIFALTEDRVP
jgi:hypothetical protein